MLNGQNNQDRHEALEEEAVNWIARLSSGEATQADRSELQEWRERSPEHEHAFQQARRLWLGMEGVRGTITSPAASSRASLIKSRQPIWRGWAIAATLALVALGAVLQEGQLEIWLADYRTSTGEQTSLTLADGSVIHLNTNTALSVAFTTNSRRVELLTGEAQFIVAQDNARPFVVQAAEGQTRALGTEFVVRDYGKRGTVTLLEGLVDVTVDNALPGEEMQVQLHPGEQVTYSATEGFAQTHSADLRLATAWQRGLLIFEGTPLRAVVEEINRYRAGYVMVANDEIADQHVSGVFHLNELDRALTTIQAQLNLSVLRVTDYVIFLQ